MSTNPSATTPYRVLVPVSDNEESAQAQARFVGNLPNAPASVEATLTHVLHGQELAASRELRTTARVGTVSHAKKYLSERDIDVELKDASDPYPPSKSILTLADEIDADLIVLGGGMHGFLEDLVTGNVAKSVGKQTSRPIAVVPETYPEE
jgi:nucleotide-binding universal stress UspA family protein